MSRIHLVCGFRPRRTTHEGQNIPSDLEVQHAQSPASETDCFAAELSRVQTRGRPSENVCPRGGKDGRHRKDLFGTETQISLGFWRVEGGGVGGVK